MWADHSKSQEKRSPRSQCNSTPCHYEAGRRYNPMRNLVEANTVTTFHWDLEFKSSWRSRDESTRQSLNTWCYSIREEKQLWEVNIAREVNDINKKNHWTQNTPWTNLVVDQWWPWTGVWTARYYERLSRKPSWSLGRHYQNKSSPGFCHGFH